MATLRYTILGAAAAWAVYEDVRLLRTYPLHPVAKGGELAWPDCVQLSSGSDVRARVRVPWGQNARDAFIAAFYDTWTLRIEGAVARLTGLQSTLPPAPPGAPATPTSTPSDSRAPTPFSPADTTEAVANGTPLALPRDPAIPASFANGLFPVIGHSPDSVMVWWSASDNEGGAQLLTAKRVQGGDLVDISYACAETFDGASSLFGPALMLFHQMYMRFLIDRAAATLERRARQ